MKIRHSEDPRSLRRKAYPSITDQLDALVKLADSLREQGVDMPEVVHEWIDQCMDVKQRFKKHSQ